MIGFLRFIFIVILALQPLQLLAQTEQATIRGHVVLPSGYQTGKPIVVELRSGSQIVGTTRTDTAGNFEFTLMRPGVYVIHVSEEGFQEAEYPATISAGSRYVQIRLLAIPSANRGSANAPPGPQVLDFRQLSVPKKALNEYEKAVRDLKTGKTQSAIGRLETSLKIAPDFYDAHFQLGLQYMRSDTAQAERALARAAELNPRVADPLVVLGFLYLQSSRFKQAIEVLDRAVGLDPASALALYYLGSALYETGESSRAEKLLKHSLSLDPTIHPIHLALVNIYLKDARPKEALQELEAYLQAEPHASQSKSAAQLRDHLRQQLQIKKAPAD
jgi:tetratricopeptide (TPR) repeat protein